MGEERGVAQEGVEDEALVGLRGVLVEGGAVAEVHAHVAQLQVRAGDLGGQAHGDALVGLDAHDDRVGPQPGRGCVLEGQEGRLLEHDGDLGDAPRQALARAQVEGHARPPPVGDLQAQGRVGLGARVDGDAVLLQVASHGHAALEAGPVAAPGRGGVQVEHPGPLQAHAVQDLLLLGAHRRGAHGAGLLHGGQRQELEEVVLDDVAPRADGVVVAGARADPDVLGHGDLHVVDVALVPQRLEDRVGEAQGEDVLDRLLAQVVVDAEDVVGAHDPPHQGVQLGRAGPVVAEGLLNDHAPPGPRGLVDQPGGGDALGDGREPAGRDRQVEGAVAARAAGGVEVVDDPGQAPVGGVVLEGGEGDEAHAGGELLPDGRVPRGAGAGAHGGAHVVAQVLVVPVAAPHSHQAEAGGQQPAVGQVVDGREQLVARQVAGDAEHDQHAGVRDAGQAQIPGVQQGVRGGARRAGRPRRIRCVHGCLPIGWRLAPAGAHGATVRTRAAPPPGTGHTPHPVRVRRRGAVVCWAAPPRRPPPSNPREGHS